MLKIRSGSGAAGRDRQMSANLPGRLGKVHRGFFQDVALLRDALQLGLRAAHFNRLGIHHLALLFRHTVALCW